MQEKIETDNLLILQSYLIDMHAPKEVCSALRSLTEDLQRLDKVVNDGRKFMRDSVEPLRQLAMDISLKYEPCGYYCDETVGHVDHKLCNQAKYLFGSGLEDYLPIELDPFPDNRADQQTGRF